MLSTRLLPPQFSLPAWSTRQLTQVAQRAHKSDYTRESQDNNDDSTVRQLTKRQLRRLGWSNIRRLNLNPVEGEEGVSSSQETANEELDEPQPVEQVHDSDRAVKYHTRHNDKILERQDEDNGFILYTPVKPQEDVKGVGKRDLHPRLEEKSDTQYMDLEPPPNPKQLSLFEELFPEEALARHKREKKARERLEKLPAFNWAVGTDELNVRDRNHEQARRKIRENYTSIPEMKTGSRSVLARPSSPAKQPTQAWSTGLKHEWEKVQQTRQTVSSGKNSRVSILVLKACSKTLEESDFFRVGPKGNHIESWTNGILKVIPARDNVTLEPLGQYFLLFSSIAAARLYLDKTLRLLELTKSNDFFSKPYGRSRLREGEDLEAVLRNFTLVPAGGKLSLRLLHPPYSRGLQWMIDAGGPAPLVARQEKAQNIILLSTDRGYVKSHELENAIMEDGKRRNLHWKLAGATGEAIVKLETKGESAWEDVESQGGDDRPRSRYRGPARYTISFKDSNEARRFVREWHRRPFPTRRPPQPGDDAPPIIKAEILW